MTKDEEREVRQMTDGLLVVILLVGLGAAAIGGLLKIRIDGIEARVDAIEARQ